MDYRAFEPVRSYLAHTRVSAFMLQVKWAWATCETLHFIGLSMLFGTVGLFDLRLLGLAKRVPLAALHRLIPIGVAGFGINVVTGFMFLCGMPDQYLYNEAFRLKMLFVATAGANVAVFYAFLFRQVWPVPAGQNAALPARIAGGISLAMWIGVVACGRMLTFFRPPFVN